MVCRAVLSNPCYHSMCRQHAPCRSVLGHASIWDPAECRICLDLIRQAFEDPTASAEQKQRATEVLRRWVRGFAKNQVGKPYLPSEDLRKLLFPRAGPESVYVVAHESMPGTSASLPLVQLHNLSIDREAMDSANDPDVASPSREEEEELLQEETSVILETGVPKDLQPPLVPQSVLAAPPGLQAPPLPATPFLPAAAGTPISAAALGVPSGSGADLETIIARVTSHLLSNMHLLKTPQMPGQPTAALALPPWTPDNPWRPCAGLPLNEGYMFLSGALGARPLHELEFFPNREAYPNCYVRLTPDAAIRTDVVPKEVVLYDHKEAQSQLVSILSLENCVNTQQTAFGGRQVIFRTPKEMVLPFATKSLTANLRAWPSKGPTPTLEECKAISLVLPADGVVWDEVHMTFTVGKLENSVASMQFKEELPLIPARLLTQEYVARQALAEALSHQTLLEILVSNRRKDKAYTLLAKQHLGQLHRILHQFGIARRLCREHVFIHAKVKHEPRRLIDSSLWGKDLFPADIVQEILEKAALENRSLLDKWGIGAAKRKFTPGAGPQPKKSRGQPPVQQPRLPSTVVHQAPVSLPPQSQYVYSSPVVNPTYEAQGTTTFHAVPKGQSRGRGKGHRRGGKHHGKRSRGAGGRGRGAQQ